MDRKGEEILEKRSLWYTIVLLIIIILCTWGFFEIADNFNSSQIHHFDSVIITYIQGYISAPVTSVMLWITFLGSTKWVAIITLLMVILLFIMRHRLLSIYLALTVAIGAGVFNQVLKYIFKRARPDIHRVIQEQGYSFPSGHSMGSMILYGSLAFILFKLYKHLWAKIVGAFLAVLLILCVGISRIYLGVHYPSDVVGGYSAGAVWVIISIVAFIFFEKRQNHK
jgi:membrane-associated phospholipid phosphatase